MSNFCITAIVPFLEYILLYGACCGIDKTDMEKQKRVIKRTLQFKGRCKAWGVCVSSFGNKTYEYDKRGNLIGITDRGKRVRAYEYDITGSLGLSYSKLGKARSYSYDGIVNRIGIKEYEEDTYCTQGQIQPLKQCHLGKLQG